MSIVKMKKLRAIAPRSERDELMLQLMRLGCVQVVESEALSDPDAAALLRPERADLPRLRTEENRLAAALRVLNQYAPEKKKLLDARPEVGETEFLDGEALARDLALAEELVEWDAAVRRLTSDEIRVRSEIEALTPWAELDMPLNAVGTRRTAAALVSAIAQIDPSSVSAAVEGVTDAAEIELVSADETQRCFLLLTMKEELPAVLDAVRAIGCTQASFPGLTGTARENIDRLSAELGDLAAQKADLIERITEKGGCTQAVKLSSDRMAAELARAEAVERLAGTDSAVLLEGWYPVPEERALSALFDRLDCAWESEDPAPEEFPDVPVKLENRNFVEPMSLVTEMYSLPAYDGIDPNPLMWPFFVLFYGIMMADMGYGLLMILASVIAVKKMRPKGGTGYLLKLLGMCGVSTFVFGAMTGGFFGDLIPQIAKMINPDTTLTALPSLFTPLGDVMMIMVGSLALGVVQIFTGMIVNVVYKCRNGQALSALFEEGAWWCILFGIVLAVLGLGPWLLIAGGALLVIGQFWEKKSVVGGLVGLFGAIYNGVTGYFSDILSYLRLMALMLAGNVIAMVFNQLGAMTGSVFVFIIVAMIGNGLNFALNLLGCFVHDLRLQVLEFFGRFYKDGGRSYRPLNIDPQYVDLIKEET